MIVLPSLWRHIKLLSKFCVFKVCQYTFLQDINQSCLLNKQPKQENHNAPLFPQNFQTYTLTLKDRQPH